MATKREQGKLQRKDLDRIFNDYYSHLFNYFYYHTLNRASSEDLVSSVMVKIVRYYETYDSAKGNLDAWIWRIARNEFYSYLRRNRPQQDIDTVPEGLFATDDEYDGIDETGRTVRALLEVLNDEERELVYLKYWKEMSNKEIAEFTGLNASTVSTKLWRASEKMRKASQD